MTLNLVQNSDEKIHTAYQQRE